MDRLVSCLHLWLKLLHGDVVLDLNIWMDYTFKAESRRTTVDYTQGKHPLYILLLQY